MKRLYHIIPEALVIEKSGNMEITVSGLQYDSRKIEPGNGTAGIGAKNYGFSI